MAFLTTIINQLVGIRRAVAMCCTGFLHVLFSYVCVPILAKFFHFPDISHGTAYDVNRLSMRARQQGWQGPSLSWTWPTFGPQLRDWATRMAGQRWHRPDRSLKAQRVHIFVEVRALLQGYHLWKCFLEFINNHCRKLGNSTSLINVLPALLGSSEPFLWFMRTEGDWRCHFFVGVEIFRENNDVNETGLRSCVNWISRTPVTKQVFPACTAPACTMVPDLFRHGCCGRIARVSQIGSSLWLSN